MSRADDAIAGVTLPSQLGGVGLTQEYGAGAEQSFDQRGVEVGNPLFVEQRASGGANVLGRGQVLDRQGYAAQWRHIAAFSVS